MFKMIHSFWAYFVLLILVVAIVNAIIGVSTNKKFKAKDLRISLFALIASHVQLIIGFIAFFYSVYFAKLTDVGMGVVMKNSEFRKALVEHPLVGIIAIALITIGYAKHKKKATNSEKFKTIAIFYSIALILILSRIPWIQWFSN